MNMDYMESPTRKGNYTAQDLREYTLYRKTTELDRVKKLMNGNNLLNGTTSVDDYDRIPLAIFKEVVITVELSTGGDADGFKITLNEEYEPVSGVYYWADWGVYEEVQLNNEELELVDSMYSISNVFKPFC
jgi:hypothetical protein